MSNDQQPNKTRLGRFREPLNHTFEQRQRSFPRCLVFIVMLGTLVLPNATSQSPVRSSSPEKCGVHGITITVPVGDYVLIRKGDQIGAIRITKVTQDTQTAPRGHETMGSIDYESSFSVNGSSLSNPVAKKSRGELRYGRMKGVGFHYSWQSGNSRASVGPWKLLISYPNSIVMTNMSFWNGIDHDAGLEFAPTAFTDVSKLNPRDPRLRWFRYNRNSDIDIPISELPQR